MGLMRFWLAMLVFLHHLGGGLNLNHFMEGLIAVKCFFIISGFLIQLVLLQKYQNANSFWQLDFWTSRFLRIYPLYWIVLLASVIFLLITGMPPRVYMMPPTGYGMDFEVLHHKLIFDHDDLLAKIWYVATHVCIFGYDLSQYIIYNLDESKFTLVGNSPYVGHLWGRSFTLITQAWSIAIELWFYVLAPFILIRRTTTLIVLTLAITLIRHVIHFSFETYALDIFSELCFFVTGALMCRLYLRYLKDSSDKYYRTTGILMLAIFVFAIKYQSIHFIYKDIAFYMLAACSLPLLFHTFRQNKFDRFLGDLSYPIYLIHFLAYGLAVAWFSEKYQPYAILGLTLSLAVFSVVFIERPIEKLRHRLFRRRLQDTELADKLLPATQ